MTSKTITNNSVSLLQDLHKLGFKAHDKTYHGDDMYVYINNRLKTYGSFNHVIDEDIIVKKDTFLEYGSKVI